MFLIRDNNVPKQTISRTAQGCNIICKLVTQITTQYLLTEVVSASFYTLDYFLKEE